MTAIAPTPAPRAVSSRWLVLVIVCLAQFMVVLDATIVNVALPSIQRGLGFSTTDLQWVVNAYTLVFGGFLLLGGRMADLLGRKRLFVIGAALFSFASLINGIAWSPGMLIAGRALQGLGGALISPAALAIITTTFPDRQERTRALGIWSAIAAGGGAAGLLLGGILTDVLSWEWVFLVNLPVGLIALALALRYVPESRGKLSQRGFDLAGAFSVTAGLVVLVYAIVQAQAWGWGSGRTLGLVAVALVLLTAFVLIERRSRAPLMRLSIFKVRSLATADLVLLLVASRPVRDVLLRLAVRAGRARLQPAEGRPGLPARHRGHRHRRRHRPAAHPAHGRTRGHAPRADAGHDRHGPAHAAARRRLLPDRPAARPGDPSRSAWAWSSCRSRCSPPRACRPRTPGLASGLFNTAQQVGGSLGLAVLSSLAATRTADVIGEVGKAQAQVDGFHVAFWGASILLAAGVVVFVAMLRRRHVAGVEVDAAPAAA